MKDLATLFLVLPFLAGCKVAELQIKEGEIDPWHKSAPIKSSVPQHPPDQRSPQSRSPETGSLRLCSLRQRTPAEPRPVLEWKRKSRFQALRPSRPTIRPAIHSQPSWPQETFLEGKTPQITAYPISAFPLMPETKFTSTKTLSEPHQRPTSPAFTSLSCTDYEKRQIIRISTEAPPEISAGRVQQRPETSAAWTRAGPLQLERSRLPMDVGEWSLQSTSAQKKAPSQCFEITNVRSKSVRNVLCVRGGSPFLANSCWSSRLSSHKSRGSARMNKKWQLRIPGLAKRRKACGSPVGRSSPRTPCPKMLRQKSLHWRPTCHFRVL